jgi:hypothetical protein
MGRRRVATTGEVPRAMVWVRPAPTGGGEEPLARKHAAEEGRAPKRAGPQDAEAAPPPTVVRGVASAPRH